jgi:transposase InsO family protein
LTTNIISIRQLDEAKYKIHVDDGVMHIQEPDGRLLARIVRVENKLYLLHLKIQWPVCLEVRGHEDEVAWWWHERFGHVNMAALRKLEKEELVRGLPKLGQVERVRGLPGRQAEAHFLLGTCEYWVKQRLELVHGDLCGPITPMTPIGNKYFLLLVDDLSRYMWMAAISSKDQAVDAVKRIQMQAEGESGLKLKTLRTDRGGEFTSGEFAEYCAAGDVHRQHTAPYSPQQNGVVERWNGTVVATTMSMLKAKKLPGWFWGEAVKIAVYVLNRCPTKSVDVMTPFEAWHDKKPAVHHLKTFGCIVYVRNAVPHLKKLEDQGRKMIFIGYEEGSKAYHAYDPVTEHVHVSRDAIFDEQAQWVWETHGDTISANEDQDAFTMEYAIKKQTHLEEEETVEESRDEQATGQSEDEQSAGGLSPLTPNVDAGYVSEDENEMQGVEFASPPEGNIDEYLDAYRAEDDPLRFRKIDGLLESTTPPGYATRRLLDEELHAVSADEPVSFGEAERSPSWRKAVMEEMKSIEDNQTWTLAYLL